MREALCVLLCQQQISRPPLCSQAARAASRARSRAAASTARPSPKYSLSFMSHHAERIQWVAGIKKTGFRGTPPFLMLSTALTHPTPWFLSSGRHSSQTTLHSHLVLESQSRPEGILGK